MLLPGLEKERNDCICYILDVDIVDNAMDSISGK